MLTSRAFRASSSLSRAVLSRIPQRKCSLKVRRATSADELKPALDVLRDFGAFISEGDEHCYFAADPTGHWVGEIDGELVSFSSFVKYPKNQILFYALGATKPAFRNRGLVREIGKVVLKDSMVIPRDYRKRVYMVENAVFAGGMYGPPNLTWKLHGMTFGAMATEKALHNSATFKPVSIREAGLDALCKYEESIINLHRRNFLINWIGQPGREGWAALDTRGNVTGCVVTMPLIQPAGCYKVAPLYADSLPIARCLLHTVARHVADRSSKAQLYMVVPLPNASSLQMVTQHLGGAVMHRLVLHESSHHQDPTVNFDKLFSVASLTVG